MSKRKTRTHASNPTRRSSAKTRRSRTGAEQNARKQQRLEERREARAKELAAQHRARRRRGALRRGLIITLLTALGVWFFTLRSTPVTEIRGHEIESLSVAGEGQHVEGQVDYESSPPVSGSHSPQPAACGTHSAPIANESQVHTLEHGAVGIQYLPDLETQQIREIESLVSEFDSHTFSAPYPDMDAPIAVTSWGRIMRFDTFDERAARDYITEFIQKGPEEQDCPASSEQTFKPPASEGEGG
ncbi:MAG: DUF3105 domain-containing protein [Actinobacteria bacterium]|nr:DUF3105 domain-containing protein [Actinomycetota bacterium]